MISRRSMLCRLSSLFAASQLPVMSREVTGRVRRLVLGAGKPSHPPGCHEHYAGMMLLADCLKSIPNLEVTVVKDGWPKDNALLETADAFAIFSDGLGSHPVAQPERLAFLERQVARGMSIGMMHFAVHIDPQRGGTEFKRWIGGHYESDYSCNPIWRADLTPATGHPVTRGVAPFTIDDEWYFNMRFREDPTGVTPLLLATPSESVRNGPYVHPRGPYPHIQAAKGRKETLMWGVERKDGGRGFGFTGGHYHRNWADENFRKLILNALVWLSQIEVPSSGVASSVTPELLTSNLDPK